MISTRLVKESFYEYLTQNSFELIWVRTGPLIGEFTQNRFELIWVKKLRVVCFL